MGVGKPIYEKDSMVVYNSLVLPISPLQTSRGFVDFDPTGTRALVSQSRTQARSVQTDKSFGSGDG